jgi:hypothetical protein
MQWSFSLNYLGVRLSLQSWRWCLKCCYVVVSSNGTHKVEQNYTHMHKKKPTKCPKFKCNTVSVSFSACRCNSVVLSSKVGRQRKQKKESGDSSENGICNCVLPACCCQPAVAGISPPVTFLCNIFLSWEKLYNIRHPHSETSQCIWQVCFCLLLVFWGRSQYCEFSIEDLVL